MFYLWKIAEGLDPQGDPQAVFEDTPEILIILDELVFEYLFEATPIRLEFRLF